MKTETRLMEPLCMSALRELETTEGTSDETDDKALEEEIGFGYGAALGELIYA